MQRVTHKQVSDACERYNAALGLTEWNAKGRLQWADIAGTGTSKPKLYSVCNPNGGVTLSHLNRPTMRKTIAAITCAIQFYKLPSFAIIIRCIHERGPTQVIALNELNRRGLWLSPEQRKQAGLAP